MAILAGKTSRSRTPSMSRLEARIPRELKKTLERAAAVTGHPTLTSFMIYSLQTSARKAIEEHQQATLTADGSMKFVEALLTPPAPNDALRAALGAYRRDVRAGA